MPANIIEYLSALRMGTYLSVCDADEERAVSLYRANARVSGSAFTSLHYFEVILRNAIDQRLRAWNLGAVGTTDWTLNAAPLLVAVVTLDRLNSAREDARKAVGGRRQPNHNDVLAQMSLGTWRFLMPSTQHQGKQKLWEEALEGAFPNRHGLRADQLASAISIAYDFRNRVAHHEPVFALNLHGKRQAMRTVLQAVGAEARKWYAQHEPMSGAVTAFYQEWPQFEYRT